ncbi:MAG TPA: hypothetical protein VMV33_17055 [Rhodocyclaceae bacterium]|nr:hypothetical protein [Rhodocyclaceae bacterium]
MELVQAIASIPWVGHFLVYVGILVAFGASLAPFVPAPAPDASRAYLVLYAVVKWCALQKGHATSVGAVQAGLAVPPVTPSYPPGSEVPGVNSNTAAGQGAAAGKVGLFLLLAATMSLSACGSSGQPMTVRQSTYAAIAAYDAGLKVAIAYLRLPRCGIPNAPPVCADVGIVQQIDDAVIKASPVVAAARTAAADPTSTSEALVAGQIAVNSAGAALTALLPAKGK